MKGLLIKDIYVLSKQMKAFLVLTLVFAVVQQTVTQGFGLMYLSSLPVTALAYDEQVKWNSYAAMMPYRTRNMVLSKYALGAVGCFCIFLIELAAAAVYGMATGQSTELLMQKVQMILLFFCIAMILMSINLPLVLRLGVEKGRYLWMFITISIGVLIVSSVENLPELWQLNPVFYPLAAGVAAAVSLVVSIGIALKVYRSKYC